MPIPTSDRPFDRLASELVADQLAAEPTLGSTLGLTEYDELLPDLSAEAIAARERSEDAWLERFRALPDADLDADEQIDRDLVVMVLQGRAAKRDWADWRRSPDLYAGTALSSVFGLLMYRLRPEPELAAAVAARLTATPSCSSRASRTSTPPSRTPPWCGGPRAWPRPVRSTRGRSRPRSSDEQGRALVAAAGETAGAAFERFGAHLETLAETAHGEWAIGEEGTTPCCATPRGCPTAPASCAAAGRSPTTSSPPTCAERAEKLRGDDDWRALLDELSADHPETPEEMLSLYREATAAAREFCVDNELVTMPPGERCEVVPSAPFTRAMVAVAHYSVPPPFAPGDHAGHFFVPYPPDGATPEQVAARLATNNRHGLWSITVHEAYPGHHWHFAWLAGNPDNPGRRALRAVFGSTYFVEGWGLYTEDLLREQGFFATPEQELCQRDFRLFRAARIIVDTSLHLGEMTIEEAVDFMSTKASLSRDTAQAEVLRYCAWPTQASSYLTGALELERMRQRWFNEARGSLRDFHDRAAGSGRLPISLVERALFG